MHMRFSVLGAAIVLAVATGSPSESSRAESTSVLRHNPYPCSVLSRHPCVYRRTFCSVFSHHPCQPEIDYPIGQDFRLTMELRNPQRAADSAGPEAKAGPEPEHKLDTLHDLFAALRSCRVVPPDVALPEREAARPGTEVSVRLYFKRNGELAGEPRITYVTPGTSLEIRRAYSNLIITMLKRCTPLPLTARLGGALVGRAIFIRFVDNRMVETEP